MMSQVAEKRQTWLREYQALSEKIREAKRLMRVAEQRFSEIDRIHPGNGNKFFRYHHRQCTWWQEAHAQLAASRATLQKLRAQAIFALSALDAIKHEAQQEYDRKRL